MANINTYLSKILSAIYGEEVRGSIHDALKAVNEEATKAANDAAASAADAEQAVAAANTAAGKANTAAGNANTAATTANAAAERAEAAAGGAITDKTVTFTQASTRANINTGESMGTLLGKIKKWFADLGTSAFQTVANNLTTTAAGSVLDARQGKALADMHKVSRIELLTSGSENSAVNGAYIKKSGNVKLLTVAGTIKIAMDAGTEYTLGQITNTDYQPTYLVQQIEIIRPNGDIGAIKIATDGTVSLTPNVTMAVNTTLRFRTIYV